MDNKNSKGGIGFFTVLGLIFITLKLCHVITWPWVWVLAPIWGSIALALVLVVILFICDYFTNNY